VNAGRVEGGERPPHTVRVGSFWMDRFEVTQAEYEKLGFPNPSRIKGADLAMEMMTWAKAALFANARSRAEDLEPCSGGPALRRRGGRQRRRCPGPHRPHPHSEPEQELLSL